MNKANYQLLNNYIKILTEGLGDFDMDVRPRWKDGTPAHTVRIFGAVNRYNLQDGFPISSLRKVRWKSAIDEVLWLWQKKSNNIKDLNAKIWDQWANKGEHPEQEIGSIGKAYGYQYGKKCIRTKDGKLIDQVDNVLHEIKFNPANRRIITEIFNLEELNEMNLAPCVHQATFNVNNGYLNMMLNQRSHDTLAAGAWNVVQYAALLAMFAQVSGLKPGELLHVVTDSHCYDRHIPREFQVILHGCSLIQQRAYKYYLEDILAGQDEEVCKNFLDVLHFLKQHEFDIDFNLEFEKAEKVSQDGNTNWQEYLNYVRKTPEMNVAKTLVQKMIETPKIDDILGFKTPKLVLDPNVKDFYDFKSPNTYTGSSIKVENGQFVRDGKYVSNPDSSFEMVDYATESEGFEFSTPVPVAK